MPAVAHPAPRDVAIIGLGTGGTAWAVGCRREIASVTVFEIFGPQPRLLAAFRRLELYAPLETLMGLASMRSNRRGECSRAFRPSATSTRMRGSRSAYSGNLYSVEFFRRCARRFKPGGFVCTRAPMPRIYASFHAAFPYAAGLENRSIVVGSNEPISVEVVGLGRPHLLRRGG